MWSKAADGPGAYFLVPYDDKARTEGLKYVVVRAQMGRSSHEPDLSVIRSDPPRPDLLEPKKGTRR